MSDPLSVGGRAPVRSRRPWVFAVEDNTVQVCWRAATFRPGPVRFRIADTAVEVPTTGTPGAVVLGDLPAATDLELRVDGDGVPARWRTTRVRTLPSPPGAEVFRFATISDLHIGNGRFGYRATLHEAPTPNEPPSARAARAAGRAMEAWGAALVLVKGDLTHRGRRSEWQAVGSLLRELRTPVEMLPGNHDTYRGWIRVDPWQALADLGHELTRHCKVVDVPGLRIVLADSTQRDANRGRIGHLRDEVTAAVRGSAAPAFVTMHHNLMRLPVATFWPPGIPSTDAAPLLRSLAAEHPATMISTGHTHRHRRRHVGPLVLTEVGSPKDFPGTWAGYAVHEGGIRQVVRRVDAPDVLHWTDYTARAALGAWGMWSPGLLGHRCFTHTWPTPATGHGRAA